MGEVLSYTKEGIEDLLAGLDFASQADVDAAIAALVDAAPGALDTLNELAAALGDDANLAATLTAAIAAEQTARLNGDSTLQGTIDFVATSLQGAVGAVVHGSNPSVARPVYGYGFVHWIGSVEPTNAIDNDVWTDTSA